MGALVLTEANKVRGFTKQVVILNLNITCIMFDITISTQIVAAYLQFEHAYICRKNMVCLDLILIL